MSLIKKTVFKNCVCENNNTDAALEVLNEEVGNLLSENIYIKKMLRLILDYFNLTLDYTPAETKLVPVKKSSKKVSKK